MPSSKRMIGLALTYVGAVVGAGFASGQEILYFFARFGTLGLAGTWVAGLGFALLGPGMLMLANRQGLTSYHELLPFLLGKNWGRLAEAGLSLYLFSSLVIMLAGCGTVFGEYFHLSHWLGVGLSMAVLAAALFVKEEGVLALNAFLIPVVILGTIVVGGLAGASWGSGAFVPGSASTGHWLVSAILYVSYNMIGGMVILVRFAQTNAAEGMGGGLLGGLILGLLAWLVGKALLDNYQLTHHLEIPMLYLAHRQGAFLGLGYSFVLWFAMLTSAVVNTAALGFRFADGPLPYPVVIVLLLLAAALLTGIGFSVLIQTLYPAFGYLGVVILGGALWKWRGR